MFVIEQVMLYNAIACIIALKFQTEFNKKKEKDRILKTLGLYPGVYILFLLGIELQVISS